MADGRSTYFATERAEYEARRKAGESVVLAPALHTPQRVQDLASYYGALADAVDNVNVLNPISSARSLRDIEPTSRDGRSRPQRC